MSERELRGMFTFCPGIIDVDHQTENGEVQGLARFRNSQSAMDAVNHLNGWRYNPVDPESEAIWAEPLPMQSLPSSSPGNRNILPAPLPQHPFANNGPHANGLSPPQAPFAGVAVPLSSSASSTSSNPATSRFARNFADSFYPGNTLNSSSLAPGSGLAPSNSSQNDFYADVFNTTSPRTSNLSAPGQPSSRSSATNMQSLNFIDKLAMDDMEEELLNNPLGYLQSHDSNDWDDLPNTAPLHRLQGQQLPTVPNNMNLRRNTTTSLGPNSVNSLTNRMQNGLTMNPNSLPDRPIPPHPHQPMHGMNHITPSPAMNYSNPPQHPVQNRQPFFPMPPNSNPADQNPPCNTLYVGNLPMNTSEDELKALFSQERGYKRLCFRTKANGPMCFVEFENVECASRSLAKLHGHPLSNSVKGGVRLSFSKNPLGVRNGQQTGVNGLPNAFGSGGVPPPPGLGPSGGMNGPPSMAHGGNVNGSVNSGINPAYVPSLLYGR